MDAPNKTPTRSGSDACEDEGIPLYNQARRWRTYLSKHSAAFRCLQEERERGWKSTALDAWYARRNAPAAPPSSPSFPGNETMSERVDAPTDNATLHPASAATTATDAAASSPATPPNNRALMSHTSAAPSAVPSGPNAVGTTSFVAADVVELSERYRQHARHITHLAAASFFAKPSTPSTTPAPLFLDLGCAPGGVSKYLSEDLRWQGVGVTLASTSGGIEVNPSLLDEERHGDDFALLDGDVTQPSSQWRRSAAYPPVTSLDLRKSTRGSIQLAEIFHADSQLAPSFHFVNGGAVLDHGQRQRQAQALDGETEGTAGAEKKREGSSPHTPSSSSAPPLLPWFSLLVPQLKTALTYTAAGGAMMLVHGAPHCASLFILLRCMEDVVGACAPDSPPGSGCHASVLETMHLAKPPVYLLWTNVWPTPSGTATATTSLTSPSALTGEDRGSAARQRLLESLDAASPRISPLSSTNEETMEGTEGGLMAQHSTVEAKQRFWLGESEEGFRLAVEGFARYGAQVEKIWRRVGEFLLRRRERAEREMMRERGRHAGGPRKRMHSDT